VDAGVSPGLADFDLAGLQEQLATWGLKRVHASRVLRAFYAHDGGPVDWSGLGLPVALVARLDGAFSASVSMLAARQVAPDGTAKLLLRLHDGRTVESVMMPDYRGERVAGCLSTQVGCAMGCDFCATTKTGFERNLTAGEMVEQFLALRREARAIGRKLHTIVFMGMGEPLLNLDAVLAAIHRIASNGLGNLGWRQITVSTVGIVPGMDALDATGLNINLAVSLHAPDDTTRAQLLPMGRRYGVAEIMAAMDRFQGRRGRPTIIQYCLLRGVNDSREHARALAAVVGARRIHVNLLTYNPTGLSLRGIAYEPSTEAAAEAFFEELRAHKVVTHFRRSRGPEIDAACGQLRRRAAAAGPG
jgi:23S rRNA (adenine2503-C2)-methyltransferase